MNIKLVFDKVGYSNKPQGFEVGKIIKRMTFDTAKEYSIAQIKDNILEGKTVRPSYCGGKEDSWESQQVFMIDIDNKPSKAKGMSDSEYEVLCQQYLKEKHRTYHEVIQHCKDIGIIPSFVYTSFNHKPEHHKMRLVFILDKEITDYETAKKIQLYLMNVVGDVDEQCKNLNRIYYAGKNIVFDSGNVLDSFKIIQLSKDINVNEMVKKDSKPNNDKGLEKSPPNNIKIYKNSYIIRGTKTQEQDETRETDDYYNIKAIANRDIKYLKEKLNYPHKVCNNNQEFIDYIVKEIDLGALLEFKYPKSIRCIFHDDNSPSASIFQNEIIL